MKIYTEAEVMELLAKAFEAGYDAGAEAGGTEISFLAKSYDEYWKEFVAKLAQEAI